METLRIGQAAALLGVSVDTLRNWTDDGTVKSARTSGGQRAVPIAEVLRLLKQSETPQVRIAAQSARNSFEGNVSKVVKDKASAVVELQAGPHRLVSLMTRDAADELKLKPGMVAVAAVKATSVVVEIPE